MHTYETVPPAPADLLLAISALPSSWVIRYNHLRLRLPLVQAARTTLREYDDAEGENLTTTIVCGEAS